MENDLPTLLCQIPQLICPALFQLVEPNAVLDLRDVPPFDSEWFRVHQALVERETKSPPSQAARESIRAIEQAAFRAVYAATPAKEYTEFAPCVSEDFGLFARALCYDFRDSWLGGLLSSYRRGIFPTGSIDRDDTSILNALLTNSQQEKGARHSGRVFLFRVTDVFEITGRGCVLIPGIPPPSDSIPVVRKLDTILLRRPDGSEWRTFIRELEFFRGAKLHDEIPLLLPREFTKANVPIGTEVWLAPV